MYIAVLPKPKNIVSVLPRVSSTDDHDSAEEALGEYNNGQRHKHAHAHAPVKAAPAMTFKLLSRDAKGLYYIYLYTIYTLYIHTYLILYYTTYYTHAGRVESRQLLVPTEAPMALKLVQSEEVRREERQRLKEKVLQISESLDEEV